MARLRRRTSGIPPLGREPGLFSRRATLSYLLTMQWMIPGVGGVLSSPVLRCCAILGSRFVVD